MLWPRPFDLRSLPSSIKAIRAALQERLPTWIILICGKLTLKPTLIAAICTESSLELQLLSEGEVKILKQNLLGSRGRRMSVSFKPARATQINPVPKNKQTKKTQAIYPTRYSWKYVHLYNYVYVYTHIVGTINIYIHIHITYTYIHKPPLD